MKDTSYGIIPLRRQSDNWEVFLVQHQAGHWSFPKGHPEPGEQPQETAIRELKEETGLSILKFLIIDPIKEQYNFIFNRKKIDKSVYYFPALVEGHELIQKKELIEGRWMNLSQAHEQMTFNEGKRICTELMILLKNI